MSISSTQSTIARLQKQKADIEKAKSQEAAALARLLKEIAALEASASRSSSQSTRLSKQRDIARKRDSVAAVQKRLAKHETDLARVVADLSRAQQSLARAEASERAKQEAADKKRRSEELKHSRAITSELQRQARLYSDASTFPIAQPNDLYDLAHQAAEPIDPLQKQAQEGVAERAAWIATHGAGVAGATIMAVLAVSSVLPLMPCLSAATILPWLTTLGINSFAAWLGSWAEQAAGEAFDQEGDALLERIAGDLQQALRADELLAAEVANLLAYTEATTVAIRALADETSLQRMLIERVLGEVQRGELMRGELQEQVMKELSHHSLLLLMILDHNYEARQEHDTMIALLRSIQAANGSSSAKTDDD
jgi:hypothetical protein